MHAAARTLPMAPQVTGAVATDMPPFALPGWHFAIALAWLVAGSAGLFWAAPLLATGQWLTPVTAAVTHTFTLGWLLTSAYGVLYQVGPVALGVHARNWRAGFVTLALHTTGAVLLSSAYIGAFEVSGRDLELARSFLILVATTYGILVFWDTCGVAPTQPRSMLRHPWVTLAGLVIGVVGVAAPQLLPDLFKATVLPVELWLIYLAALLPVSWLFRRLVTWRVALTRPVRSLFEGS